jgi:hypothetical protein
MVYGMLHMAGVKPKRSKHEVHTAGRRMITTRLTSNKRVSLPAEVRQNVRAEVYQLEAQATFGTHDAALDKQIMSLSSKVGRLNSFHPSEGKRLKARLKAIRQKVAASKERLTTGFTNEHSQVVDAILASKTADPPWL